MSSRSVIVYPCRVFLVKLLLLKTDNTFLHFLRISCMTMMYFDHIQLPIHLSTPESTLYLSISQIPVLMGIPLSLVYDVHMFIVYCYPWRGS